MQQPGQQHAVAPVSDDQPLLYVAELRMRIWPAGQCPGMKAADGDHAQVGWLSAALVPDHQLVPATVGEADHRLMRIARALKQPGHLPGAQVTAVQERTVPLRRRAVTPP